MRLLHRQRIPFASAFSDEQIVSTLSAQLEPVYGRGFEKSNLHRMVKFATLFPDEQIVVTLSRQLSWSHFLAQYHSNEKKVVIASDRRERGNLVRLARLRRLPRRCAPRNDIPYLKGIASWLPPPVTPQVTDQVTPQATPQVTPQAGARLALSRHQVGILHSLVPTLCVGMQTGTLLRPSCDAGASRKYTPTQERGSEQGKEVIYGQTLSRHQVGILEKCRESTALVDLEVNKVHGQKREGV